MIIIKSFYRNRNTKIFLLIISVLFLSILLLNLISSDLKQKNEDDYFKHSLVYIESNEAYESYLKSLNGIQEVEECELFDYSDEIIDSNLLNYYDLNNKILVKPSSSLLEDEVIIYLNYLDYNTIYKNINALINQKITFIYNNRVLDFKIKSVEEADYHNYIVIPNNTFQSIKNEDLIYRYTFKINSDKYENDIYNNIKENKAIDLFTETLDELNQRNKIRDYAMYLQIVNYIMIILFIIITVIINRNLLSDLNKNVELEYKLGFSKIRIKINLLKRVCSLHLLSLILVVIILFIINSFSSLISFESYNIKMLILLFIVEVISNIELILANTKK